MCLPERTSNALGRRSPRSRAWIAAVLVLTSASGCSWAVRSATSELADSMTEALLDHDDPATVRAGAPAYLLLLDGLVRSDPGNVELVVAAARLYSTYASSFTEEPERSRRLAARARRYGEAALCRRLRTVCAAMAEPFESFQQALARADRGDVAVLYGMGAAWATWISVHSDDWNAVADLPRVEALMARVVELEETFDDGGAHLYLGVLLSQRPESLGGRPEAGRRHFERALELSESRNLMAKVLLARYYARLVFDRELHDRLLNEVLEADARIDGFTLSNTLAQTEARALLASSEDYF